MFDFIRVPCPAAKTMTPISFMMIIDYSESRISVKVSDLSNTCALIIRKLPLFARLNCIYYEPMALQRLQSITTVWSGYFARVG